MKVVDFELRTRSFDVTILIPKILRELETTITDMNRENLRKGIDSEGVQISSYHPYADLTIMLKGLAGTLTDGNPDIVNLHDTGDFYDGMFLLDPDKGIDIDSKDSKTSKLKSDFSPDILGLTRENLIELKPFILPLLKIEIMKYLNGQR